MKNKGNRVRLPDGRYGHQKKVGGTIILETPRPPLWQQVLNTGWVLLIWGSLLAAVLWTFLWGLTSCSDRYYSDAPVDPPLVVEEQEPSVQRGWGIYYINQGWFEEWKMRCARESEELPQNEQDATCP